jgi:hypothetical protein
LGIPVIPTAAEAAARVKIAQDDITATGCNGQSTNWRTASIPNPSDLDTAYKGELGGIEVSTWGNGRHGHNIKFTDNSTAIAYQLWAHGAGHYVHSPIGGGGVCVGAAGADSGIKIYAHYK